MLIIRRVARIHDTGLGVRVKSTGEWVGTDDDSSGIYGGMLNESQVTFTAQPGVEYEAVVGAYDDSLLLNYGVSMTSEGVTAPLNQNAATALGIAVPAEFMSWLIRTGRSRFRRPRLVALTLHHARGVWSLHHAFIRNRLWFRHDHGRCFY